ncbi:hypothetical protein D3C80_1950380 [compost metagenome]
MDVFIAVAVHDVRLSDRLALADLLAQLFVKRVLHSIGHFGFRQGNGAALLGRKVLKIEGEDLLSRRDRLCACG